MKCYYNWVEVSYEMLLVLGGISHEMLLLLSVGFI